MTFAVRALAWPRSRRLQDIESDTRYDTRRRVPEGVLARVSQTTVYDTCWGVLVGHQNPNQSSLWESKIELGEKFFHEVITNPVPLDMNILKNLKRSPLGLDLYLWLVYRRSDSHARYGSRGRSSTGSSARTRPGRALGAPWTASVRSVSASCIRFSARGRTCTIERSRVGWCSRHRRRASRHRNCGSWNSLSASCIPPTVRFVASFL